jgi:protein-tyrosine phosphatase
MQRLIDLEGTLNFRDLGGYPASGGRTVRWRVLFRSDALHRLSPADVSQLRDALGIGDVVDLRSSGELDIEGRGPLAGEPIRFHHLPLFDGALVEEPPQSEELTLADRYFLMAEFAKGPIARVITTLAEAAAPAVYHCAAGKDRTGVISALLLGLLEVPDEIIVADYAATQDNLDAIVERLMSSEGYQDILESMPPDTMHAEPETMISLLRRLRERYGSVGGYVREIGVGDAAISRLRDRLLADS